jgi:hypothetical protein
MFGPLPLRWPPVMRRGSLQKRSPATAIHLHMWEKLGQLARIDVSAPTLDREARDRHCPADQEHTFLARELDLVVLRAGSRSPSPTREMWPPPRGRWRPALPQPRVIYKIPMGLISGAPPFDIEM